jgi:hypothetical protein
LFDNIFTTGACQNNKNGDLQMKEINSIQLSEVHGGWIVPAGRLIIGGLGYIGALDVAYDFGRGLVDGFYSIP